GRLLQTRKGALYTSSLLLNPPEYPIHTLDLLNKIPQIYRKQLGLSQIIDPATGEPVPLVSGGRLQERSLSLDDAEAMRYVLREQNKLEAILEDPKASPAVKKAAFHDLQELIEFERKHGGRSIDSAHRAVRTVRMAITRFQQHLMEPEISSSDLQFLENRKFSRAEICAAFGVPEEIITTTDRAKYDVMAGARSNFIENRVAPLCARLEAEEEQNVKTIDTNAVGWFDIDSLPIMQEARRSRLAAVKTGFDMGIPFNELNRVFDLGFKALPWGNTGYLPSKLNPLGTIESSSSSSS